MTTQKKNISRLVIDDERSFTGMDAVYARTLQEGFRLLYSQPWDEVYLDHDLGSDGTIMPLVVRMENDAFDGKAPEIGVIYVHTMNLPAGMRMVHALSKGYNVVRAWVEVG